MKPRIALLSLLIFASFASLATSRSAMIANPDSFLLHSNNKYLHQQIDREQERIKREIKENTQEVQKQIDLDQLYIQSLGPEVTEKTIHLQTLLRYLQGIRTPESETYFHSGRILKNLQFFPAIIDFKAQGTLKELLEKDRPLSIKAIALYSRLPEAKDFLLDYALENPDELLRNFEGFKNEPYAPEVISKVAAYAPLSIQKYLGSFNEVRNMVFNGKDTVCRSIVHIHQQPQTRYAAYLLLNNFICGEKLPPNVEDMMNNKVLYFKTLAELHFTPEVYGKYSIDQQLKLLSTDIVREINYYYSNGYRNNVQSILSSFTPDELMLIYIYGHQDATAFSFASFVELVKYRSNNKFGKALFSTIQTEDLHSFLALAENYEKMNEVLSLVDESYKNNLLQALSYETEEQGNYEHYLDDFQFKSSNELATQETNTKKAEETHTEAQAQEITLPIVPTNSEKMISTGKEIKLEEEQIKATKIERTTIIAEEVKPVLNTQTVKIKEEELPTISSSKNISLTAADVILEGPKKLADVGEMIKPLNVKIKISDKEQAVFGMLRDIDRGFSNPSVLLDKPYAKDVLNTIAGIKPDDVFRYTKSFQSKYWVKSILETAAHEAPLSVKRYMPNESHPVNVILHYSTDSVVHNLFDIYSNVGYRSNSYLLLDDISSKRMSIDMADRVASDKDSLLHELMHIALKPNSLGQYTIESTLQESSLEFIRKINDLNVMDDATRYASVKNFTAQEIYVLMIYGQDEMFRSTFKGLYDRWKQRMGSNSYTFLQGVHSLHFRIFIKLCASFNMLDDFFSTMSLEQRKSTLTEFVSHLEKYQYKTAELVNVPDALPSITNSADKRLLCEVVQNEFQRVQKDSNGPGILIYGLLGSILQPSAPSDNLWYKQLVLTFHLPVIDRVFHEDLLNSNNENIQQHYFYNDEDGKGSFANFLNTFKGAAGWDVQMHESYVVVVSTNGTKVQIYANKPDYEANGINEIGKIMKEKNISPSIIVHRGHSFHTEKTLNLVPPDTKIVVVGSCGGYYKISIAAERAPTAHIISTRQIGTMRVNDPIIKLLADKIRNGQDIVWPEFWVEIEKQVGKTPQFPDYVPPFKNVGSLFLQAYFEAILHNGKLN